MGPGEVAGEDPGRQAVRGVVGPGHDLVLVVEGQHRHHRPEDLLGDDRHVVGAVGEDGGLDEVARGQGGVGGAPATGHHPGPLRLAAVDVAQHLVQVLGGDEGSDVGGGVEGIADAHLGHPRPQLVEEGVVDGAMDVHAGAVGADLALGVEVAEQRPGDGVVEVGVVEDDQGRLAPQLQGHRLQGRGGGRHHLLAGPHLARQGHLSDPGVGHQRPAHAGVALDDVEHSRRYPGPVVDTSQFQRREWGQLGGLEHHRVAAGQGRARLPAGDLDRVVPGPDARRDPERLPPGVGEAASQVVVGAGDRGRRPGEVLDAVGPGGDVDHQRLGDGLAGVGHLQPGQFVVALPQQGHRPVEDATPLRPRQRRPLREPLAGRLHRPVDVGGRGLVDGGDDRTGGRVAGGEGLTRGGLHLLAVDEERNLDHGRDGKDRRPALRPDPGRCVRPPPTRGAGGARPRPG